MPKKTSLPTFLCTDGKCIYAETSIESYERPIRPTSRFMVRGTELVIYCKIKHKYIWSYVSQCNLYANMRLDKWLQKEK